MFRGSYILLLSLLLFVTVSCSPVNHKQKSNETPKEVKKEDIDSPEVEGDISNNESEIDDLVPDHKVTEEEVIPKIEEEEISTIEEEKISTIEEEISTVEEEISTIEEEISTIEEEKISTIEEKIDEPSSASDGDVEITTEGDLDSNTDGKDITNRQIDEITKKVGIIKLSTEVEKVTRLLTTELPEKHETTEISFLEFLIRERELIGQYLNETTTNKTSSAFFDNIIKEMNWKSFGIGAGLGAFVIATVILVTYTCAHLCCGGSSKKKPKSEDLCQDEHERKRHMSAKHTSEKAEGTEKRASIDDSDF